MVDTLKRPYVCMCGHELNDHRDHPDPMSWAEPCRKCGCKNFDRVPRVGDLLRKHISTARSEVDKALRAVEDVPANVKSNDRVREAYDALIAADLRLQEAAEAVGEDPDNESDPLGL